MKEARKIAIYALLKDVAIDTDCTVDQLLIVLNYNIIKEEIRNMVKELKENKVFEKNTIHFEKL